MVARLDAIRKDRFTKLAQIRKLNVNPYPASCVRTHTAAEALASFGRRVAVVGRIWAIRSHGGSVFADVRDESGDIQVFFARDELSAEEFSLIKLLDVGDFVNVQGKVFKTQAGETTIRTKKLTVLTKSLRPLPTSWSGFRDVEARYRQRYADLLINPETREVALTRTNIIKLLREYLDRQGFVEVETPILQPLYGGAVAKPFITHHNTLDSDFYLRISDELYLKRLIVGGFEKVFEIGHDFRNEGVDRTHNPEFTMLEFYWAYKDYHELMDFTEDIVTSVIKHVKGSLRFESQGHILDFSPPWPRVSYRDVVLKETGIDINSANTEAKLLKEIKNLPAQAGRNIKLALDDVVGYGGVLDELYKTTTRPKLVGPLFLIDRPAAFVTLAKRKPDDPTKTGSFQLLVAGQEFVNAYNELNDPIDQAERFKGSEKLAKRKKGEHEAFDSDYIRALEYGMPPTAGWGMGLDRFVMLLTDSKNIKDVILFPTLRPEK
ncbi:lysine--tRNA ligase [Candidatus Microgenomates bacterium]|nr:lysine--tRNA ligase [Candidatus Microgenomates bacterium]